jgi:succinoglycan biosynthesis protein ExoH
MLTNPKVKQRIAMLRILLIMMTVPLHLGFNTTMDLLDYSSAADLIRFFWQNTLARLSVPALTLISGYLLFSSNLDLNVTKMYKKKFQSLVVPFFFFNVMYFAVQYGIEYFTGWAPLVVLTDDSKQQILELIFGYSRNPMNPPLHFLRDCIVLIALTPILSYLVRRFALVGFVAVYIIFMNDFDGHLINRSTMPVLFYAGAWLAVSKFDITKFDRFSILALVTLLSVCVATIYFKHQDYVYVYLIAPFTVWIASAFLVETAFGRWLIKKSKYSFYLFLVHMPLGYVIHLFYFKVFPSSGAFMYLIVTYVIVVVVAFVTYDLAMKFIPNVFGMMIGCRDGKPKQVERRKASRVSDARIYSAEERAAGQQ